MSDELPSDFRISAIPVGSHRVEIESAPSQRLTVSLLMTDEEGAANLYLTAAQARTLGADLLWHAARIKTAGETAS